jgi:hypothetical protein
MEIGGAMAQWRALVTGGPSGTCAVVAALERRGFTVVTEHGAAPWGPVRLPAGPFHCYVQLPWVSFSTATAVWMPDSLAARLDLLAAVAPRLGARAAVVLAVEDTDPRRPDASADLLAALAMVTLEEAGRPDAQVVTLPAAQLCGLSGAPPSFVEGSILQGSDRARPEAASATR